jgi:hypothetical protein
MECGTVCIMNGSTVQQQQQQFGGHGDIFWLKYFFQKQKNNEYGKTFLF